MYLFYQNKYNNESFLQQTRILEQLFAIYFRILKKTANSKLIPSVLEGLSKFAHLINLDFFEDLLKLMHQMIESEVSVPKIYTLFKWMST